MGLVGGVEGGGGMEGWGWLGVCVCVREEHV